jgi:cobalt-zinc-cadmium resistance protein CzcA
MSGNINYIEWMMLINQSMSIESEYLNIINKWNKTVVEINSYLIKN